MRSNFVVIAATVTCGITLAFSQSDAPPPNASLKKPFAAGSTGKAKTTSTQILYHGGPVMNQLNSVYVIYYGTDFASTTQPIINDFLSGLSGSPNYGVNTTYNQGANTPSIPPAYSFQAPTTSAPSPYIFFDAGSQGAQLGNSSVPKIVANALNSGLAVNPNGVYLVVTSPGTGVSGFCHSFCAYHNATDVTLANGTTAHIRYALVPDPTQKCSTCNGGVANYGDSVTPNGDLGADTMTDDIMHELSETVTDPDISAWYTQNGEENGDLCNYVYGSVSVGVSASGAKYHYNAVLPTPSGGTRPYLIQQIWKNMGAGFCASN